VDIPPANSSTRSINGPLSTESYLTWSYCFFARAALFIYTTWPGATNLLIEHCYFYYCYPNPPDNHGEFFQFRGASYITIRWNRFYNPPLSGAGLTAVIASMSDGLSYLWVYGNIFDNCRTFTLSQQNSGSASHWYIYNNTFTGIGSGYWNYLSPSDINLVNNVFYNDSNPNPAATNEHHNYHSLLTNMGYSVLLGTGDSPKTPQLTSTITSDPFVNSAEHNFNLSSELTGYAGVSIENVGTERFDLDYNGNIRGADGVWDRGAIEYGASSGGSAAGLTIPGGVTIR
jgi:hypothetical protein